MRATIAKRLAPLASLAAQRRYILNGSRDEYLLLEELLGDAYDVIRQVRTMPAARDSLSAEAVAAITSLEPLLEAADSNAHTGEAMVEHDSAWRTVREHAARCLDIMGFDLAEWERVEGLSHAA